MSSPVMAYTGKIAGNYLSLKEVKGTIPAETAVVLKGTPGTYLYKVGGEAAAIEVNDLKGTLEPIEAAGKYVLAKPEDKDVCFSYSCKKLIDTYKSSYEIGDGEWLNYEEACEAAIKYCLENLI